MKPLQHPVLADVTLTGIFHALGDPVRLKIARNLYEARTPLTCLEAVDGIDDLAASTRSHCFSVLRQAGLIRSQKEGRACYNSLRRDELEKKFPKLLRNIFAQKSA